jgi:hypothetical protein
MHSPLSVYFSSSSFHVPSLFECLHQIAKRLCFTFVEMTRGKDRRPDCSGMQSCRLIITKSAYQAVNLRKGPENRAQTVALTGKTIDISSPNPMVAPSGPTR